MYASIVQMEIHQYRLVARLYSSKSNQIRFKVTGSNIICMTFYFTYICIGTSTKFPTYFT